MGAPARSPDNIIVYCASCDFELALPNDEHLGRRVTCPNGKSHLAAVVKGDAGKFWLHVESLITRWEFAFSPFRWFNCWGGLLTDNVGRYLCVRLLLLLSIVAVEFHLPGGFLGGFLLMIFHAIAVVTIVDVMVSNISIAFISHFPANPLRTAIFTLLSFFSLAVAFAVLYGTSPSAFHNASAKLDAVSAVYFSLITLATVGYGDFSPQNTIFRIVVVCEVLIGLFFVTVILAIISSWAMKRPEHDEQLSVDAFKAGPMET